MFRYVDGLGLGSLGSLVLGKGSLGGSGVFFFCDFGVYVGGWFWLLEKMVECGRELA